MNSLGRKLKLMNYENIDIGKDDFYHMVLKLEEEKIRLYKPKEREKINYMKEKNYVEHILKYLKKLNINTTNINKSNINDAEVRTYILNNLTTLALIDDYKDLIHFDNHEDDDNDNANVENRETHNALNVSEKNNEINSKHKDETKDITLVNFFELNYLNCRDKEEQMTRIITLNVLTEKINDIFKANNIPLLECNNNSNNSNNYNRLHDIISALHLIKEKLKDKKKIYNADYENLFNFNITVSNNNLKDFAYIIKYIFNEVLKERKTHIKNILNEIQILTYNPVIDIKQGKVGR
ncbi:conserved Plasmodium protein, unknown function [Plasmodium malariae]|uniref:RNA transcription, translation and transport factor protein n=1 Tax=Plasmodium malariae TaxID=5858 RepID=A0A1D3PBV0_PLAMA|nr:conserved Plasmodium protein, unknown function [Plasmodium malariae]SCN12647.1 conserved Plasmodium protein, unknown function [Plasmodium malariae]